ncbi:3-oxoacyl-ACP synthase III family protein [Shewanella sp. SG41-3]|uniref:3-oxoacyl-ACP synthase III family protein n=1 Tax=Shewanella sp. SG41-3 TaxID=2760977 RepID=UPI0016031D72|nr:ketoacyl-ACP synthase III [Shewanella sp. SG41-3]MBB1474345.1 ketoacyl-ACP synthase III [Shewanella sp. SG41-3]
MNIYINEIASYIPDEYIDNYEKAKLFGKDNDFIDKRIGISKLSRIGEGYKTSDLAVEAVRKLIDKANLNIEEVETIVLVTQNGDYPNLPHTASVIQHKLGLKHSVSTFDIALGCSGYVYGLTILKSHMIEMGFSKGILVTADPYSKIIDPKDKNTSLIFGDAATATLLSTVGALSIGRPTLCTDGSGSDSLYNDEYLHMDGRRVYNFALKEVPEQINKHIEKNNHQIEDIDVLLLHQGSAAIINAIRKKMRLSSNKLPFMINEYGNTVSSSIPIMLEDYLTRGDCTKILISGFGVGLSWATNILTRN